MHAGGNTRIGSDRSRREGPSKIRSKSNPRGAVCTGEVGLFGEQVISLASVPSSPGRRAVLRLCHVDRIPKSGKASASRVAGSLGARLILGTAMAAMIPMITTTMTNSTKLNARFCERMIML
jgi:hypothetical protein